MYIATVPNRRSPPAILLRESYRENGKVKSRTLANITHWALERIEALRQTLAGNFDGVIPGQVGVSGAIFGVLHVLKTISDRIGITRALGEGRKAQLVLFLALARVAHQGSRLSAVRWAKNHAVKEVLELSSFDEDDLYAALDWLHSQQERIENNLYRNYVRTRGEVLSLVLYDVTSAYFEGQCNELGAYGYDRDKKKGKKQIVIGLLTGPDGEPLAVKVFKGNTSDPETISQQVETLEKRFGIKQIVFVGDRGMVKTKGKAALREAGFKYITAISDPRIRAFLNKGIFQMSLFDETIQEVEHGKLRYVLRRNPETRKKEGHRRQDKLARLQDKVTKRNNFVLQSKRAQPETGLQMLNTWIETHKLHKFVSLSLDNREIKVTIDAEIMAEDALLDGCYVIETDVPKETMNAQTVHDRYMDLQMVERDFRTLKTTLLEVRPIFLRKADRTCAHVFIAFLALKIAREMRRCLIAEFGTTDDDKMATTLEDALTALSRLCLEHHALKEIDLVRTPSPNDEQKRILQALKTTIPTLISSKKRRQYVKKAGQ